MNSRLARADGQGFDAARQARPLVVVKPSRGPRRVGSSVGAARPRINLDPDEVKNGLAQLVLTLVKLLHELMEKQAIRRIESGRLSEAECERLGLTLMRQSEQIDTLREAFGLSPEDLNIDLGPLGKLL
jgi:Gas vesicle protein K